MRLRKKVCLAINELAEVRKRIAELEALESERKHAEDAMYRAKCEGKNRVCIANDLKSDEIGE